MMENFWTPKKISDNSNELGSKEVETLTRDYRCIVCKGSKFLCGKARCPILVRYYSQIRTKPLLESLNLEGSSPPDIFIGRIGWPNVFVGPLIPPFRGDTEILGTPEYWKGKTIEEIVDFRYQLVRGKFRTDVHDVNKGKIVELTRELALSKGSTEVEAEFTKKPAGRLVLDDEVQPFGPSAPLKDIRLTSMTTDWKIEKAYSDTDLKAGQAVWILYEKGIFVSRIQKAFSAGLFGLEKNRRFVPTRWSITAVDDTVSKRLREQVKTFPVINEFRVYEHTALDNRWIVLMIPSCWSYEQMEGWYPGTTWNPTGKNVWIISDWEGFEGRSTYAETGGCYYSTRLAACEHLVEEKRQAAVVTLREIHPGYYMPVGVWHTRESIRAALKNEPKKFNSLGEALGFISTKLEIPIENWIRKTSLLNSFIHQTRLSNFIKFNLKK